MVTCCRPRIAHLGHYQWEPEVVNGESITMTQRGEAGGLGTLSDAKHAEMPQFTSSVPNAPILPAERACLLRCAPQDPMAERPASSSLQVDACWYNHRMSRGSELNPLARGGKGLLASPERS